MTRQCNKCKCTKLFSDFYKKKNGLNGYDSICKICKNEYHVTNRTDILIKKKVYRESTKDKKATYQKKYRIRNKEAINAYSAKYIKLKKESDPFYKALLNIRSRLSKYVRSLKINKTQTTLVLLGCDSNVFKTHIEQQFDESMTWDNYGQWHIDHIIPLSKAKNDEDLKSICHYKNLQPLWSKDNLKKGCREQ